MIWRQYDSKMSWLCIKLAIEVDRWDPRSLHLYRASRLLTVAHFYSVRVSLTIQCSRLCLGVNRGWSVDRGVLAADCDCRPPARQIVLHPSALMDPLSGNACGVILFRWQGSIGTQAATHLNSLNGSRFRKTGLYT